MITMEANKEAEHLLTIDLDKLRDLQKLEIKKIVKAHSKTFAVVDAMFNNHTHFTKKQEVNLANAPTHRKSKKLNEGTYSCVQLETLLTHCA